MLLFPFTFWKAVVSNTHSANFVAATSQFFSHASVLGTTIGGDITIEMWIRRTTDPGAEGVIISIGGNATSPYVEYRIDYVDVAGTKTLRFNRGRACVSNNFTSVATTLTSGIWYHIAMTYDGTNVRGYLDGTLVAGPTAQSGDGVSCGATGSGIGSLSGAGEYFDGDIDDVRIWTIVRTAAQISDNRSTELVGNETGLSAYYKLNNGVTDETVGARTLTNNNVVTFTTAVPFT